MPSTARAQEPLSANTPGAITKLECARAFEQTQRLRNTFKFVEASEEVLKCVNPACGALLAEECGKLHGELQAETPSIVPGARDENGNDVTHVSLRIGGDSKPIVIDGRPIPIDPGTHEFTFVAAGFKPVVQSAVIRTGERNRPLVARLRREAGAPSSPRESRKDSVDAAQPGGLPLATYILGGVGLVGFTGFAAFRIAGANEFDTLSRECKPTCSHESIDAARRKYTYSDVALAIGAAATIAAVTFYIAAPKGADKAAIQIRRSGDGVSLGILAAF